MQHGRSSRSARAARSASPAQRRRYEHRLRSRVRAGRGCLDSLGPSTRRLLGLRAGLSGTPLSRGEAASRLGISRSRAGRLERNGLRTLSVTCGRGGGSTQSAPPRVVRLARAAPTLQPASFLPASSAPELRPAVQLEAPRGGHAAKGTSESSRPPAGPSGGGAGSGPVSAAATSAPLDSNGPGPGLAIVMAACLATLAGLLLFALRRRAVARQHPAPVVAAPAVESSPPPAPVATYEPPPAPSPAQTAAPRTSRVTRAATVVASSAVGFAVRELVRRRARGKR